MSETLVHYICRLPKEDECIILGTQSVIAKEAFKNSTVENILLSKARVIEQSAFENCKEIKFVAWGEDNALKKESQVIFGMNESFISGFAAITVESWEEIKKEKNLEKSSDRTPVLIQNSAFKGCDKLETVIFPKNKCIIEKDAFANCKALRTVVLPGGTTEIYDDPFIGCKDLTIVCKKGDNKLCAFARAHNFRIIEID
ncbi:MAG: leucine-rich repeat protein [Spirochaetia bacterium]|nr:leucine-rich repeat protein [Spirochaetia bacterium]